MNNELEKQFFDTFGIEPKFKGYSNAEELSNGGVIPCGNIKYFNTIEEMDKVNYWCFNMLELNGEDKEYPEITDSILLELICVLASNQIRILFESMFSVINEVELLKKSILLTCIANKDTIKHQVRTLFEEG